MEISCLFFLRLVTHTIIAQSIASIAFSMSNTMRVCFHFSSVLFHEIRSHTVVSVCPIHAMTCSSALQQQQQQPHLPVKMSASSDHTPKIRPSSPSIGSSTSSASNSGGEEELLDSPQREEHNVVAPPGVGAYP